MGFDVLNGIAEILSRQVLPSIMTQAKKYGSPIIKMVYSVDMKYVYN